MNNLFPLLPLLLFALIFGAVILAAYFGRLAERKRAEALRALAAEMGFDFAPAGGSAVQSRVGKFHLFSQGRGKVFANALTGRTADLGVTVFDYRYTTGS